MGVYAVVQYDMSTVTTVATRVLVAGVCCGCKCNNTCSMSMYLQQYSSSMAQHTEAQLLLYVCIIY